MQLVLSVNFFSETCFLERILIFIFRECLIWPNEICIKFAPYLHRISANMVLNMGILCFGANDAH